MKDEKHRNISRIDHKHTHGWYARVMFCGKKHSKMFSDLKSGGTTAALLAALAWRDSIKTKIGMPLALKHIQGKANTNTGLVGIRHVEKDNKYHVTWQCPCGKHGHTSVSIKKHGKKRALKLAIQIRERKEEMRLAS